MEFADKTVMITGAGVGIGRAAALLFAEKGANVVALDMNEKSLNGLKEEIGKNILCIKTDISDENAVNEAVKAAKSTFGSVDILVNNAGIWRGSEPFEQTSAETWKKYIDINILGTVYCTKAVIADMKAKKYGRIINVASVAGVYGIANMVPYSSTKGALIAMTKGLAKEVAEYGITVNATSPGSVSPSENPDIDYVQSSELSFSKRTGSDRENAELICFIASDKAAYISGQSIQIDGCRKKL